MHIFNEGHYQAPNVLSLENIPEKIRAALAEHLKNRLTEPFYRSLRFSTGQFISANEKNQIYEYESRKYPSYAHRKVPSYELCFEFSNSSVGIDSYSAEIQFNEDGSVLDEIKLPSFRQFPQKLEFIAFQRAEAIAMAELKAKVEKAEDFDRVRLDYNLADDSIVWVFDKFSEYKRDFYGRYWRIEISAHDGRVLNSAQGDEIY